MRSRLASPDRHHLPLSLLARRPHPRSLISPQAAPPLRTALRQNLPHTRTPPSDPLPSSPSPIATPNPSASSHKRGTHTTPLPQPQLLPSLHDLCHAQAPAPGVHVLTTNSTHLTHVPRAAFSFEPHCSTSRTHLSPLLPSPTQPPAASPACARHFRDLPAPPPRTHPLHLPVTPYPIPSLVNRTTPPKAALTPIRHERPSTPPSWPHTCRPGQSDKKTRDPSIDRAKILPDRRRRTWRKTT